MFGVGVAGSLLAAAVGAGLNIQQFQAGNAFWVFQQFFGRHLLPGKQAPPGRLGCAAMKVEQLIHQHAHALCVGLLGSYAGHTRQQFLLVAGQQGFMVADLLAFFGLVCFFADGLAGRCAGGSLLCRAGGGPDAQQPVVQQVGRATVVFVVVADFL